jgi:hypothetical protein
LPTNLGPSQGRRGDVFSKRAEVARSALFIDAPQGN